MLLVSPNGVEVDAAQGHAERLLEAGFRPAGKKEAAPAPKARKAAGKTKGK